ncbi:MAG: leucine-rich repeat protein [Agathobacter sp.]|nr:leucine-rich repeat protein [Agathobacter sp.]
MKKTVYRLLDIRYWFVVFLLLLVFNIDTAYASEKSGQCGDEVYWTLNEKGVMTISGKGKMWDFRNDADYFDYHECPWADLKEDIKKVVFKSGVTYVGADAFNGCRNITKVTFTDTITTIAQFSFFCCSNLESVTLPKKLEVLGQEAFAYNEKITKVSIPDTVIFLDGAFQFNTALKEVYIGGMSVPMITTYRGAMFRGCTALEKIEVSKEHIALTVIDGMLYEKENNVLLQYPLGRKDKKITLPKETKGIADYAFDGAVLLEKVVLPEGLTSIGYYVFDGCKSLKSLTIPSTLEFIPETLGNCCFGLEYIENKSNTPIKMSNGTGTVWLDEDGNLVQELKKGTAYQHGLAIGVVVDDQVLSVGESVTVPSEIQYLNLDMPQNPKDLIFKSSNAKIVSVDENGKLLAKKAGTATITIKNRYTYEMPYMNTSFEVKINVTVNKSDKVSIEGAKITLSTKSYTYNGKAKKPSVKVVINGKTLSKNTDYTVEYKNNKNIGKATVIIKGKGKYFGTIEKNFTIKLGKGKTFTSGKYKYKVTGTSTVAFNGIASTKTTKVTIPKTVKYGGKTFKVTSVADNALKNKTKVTSVIIETNVTTIGKNAFYGCKGLKTITIKTTKLKSVGKNALKNIYAKATIKVPEKKYTAYKNILKGKGQGKKVTIKKYK